MKKEEYFMRLAIEEAKKAADQEEVPIGAIAVYRDQVIGRGYNLRERTNDATSHAEMQAIRGANKFLNNWRLRDVDLYVTLEPCSMCAGAIVLSRIRCVYYGASDPKAGAAGSLMNLLQDDRLNHVCEVVSGVLKEENQKLLKDFFKDLRKKRKINSRKHLR
ncbi:tRNA adenosine(34) deaminase TadA [Aerococcus christensenii]|uniref:tRNA-specific adenosine deaminase n=1 Tax=Aerococcus christensenii TaxID=87541 RepID=A0A2I1K691_9LACT|nr:tRNA adenosine(34) deaminase TadA [Aerococcus christensenii]PKY91107.1 tRNA adenosine(34) deaminase TadA [Aerococcus christensenii]